MTIKKKHVFSISRITAIDMVYTHHNTVATGYLNVGNAPVKIDTNLRGRELNIFDYLIGIVADLPFTSTEIAEFGAISSSFLTTFSSILTAFTVKPSSIRLYPSGI